MSKLHTQTGNVNETANAEPHDPNSDLEEDTSEANPQEEISHVAQQQPLLRRRAKRRCGRPTGTVGRLRGASNSHSRRLVGSKWNEVVDPQTEQNTMVTRTLDKTHLQLEPSDLNPAERVWKARNTGQEMGRRYQCILTTNQIPQRQHRSQKRHDLAHHGTGWLEMGFREQQTQTTTTTHDPHDHDNDNQTNNTRTNIAHDYGDEEGGVDENDDVETLLILSQIIES